MPVKSPAPNWLEPHLPVCEAIVALFAPLAEVAVHDIRRDRIVGIWNPISERKIGDRSLIDELPPYSGGRARHRPVPEGPGRRARDHVGERRAAQRQGRAARPALHQLRPLAAGRHDRPARALRRARSRTGRPELFDRDWREQILLVVDEECRSRSLRRDRLTREQRLDLVRVLDERGLFATRNAAAHAGRALGVSRTTVYALLKEARS